MAAHTRCPQRRPGRLELHSPSLNRGEHCAVSLLGLPGREVAQGRTGRIDETNRQHATLTILVCKYARIGRLIFDGPALRPMVTDDVEEGVFEIGPWRQPFNGYVVAANCADDQPLRPTAIEKRIGLATASLHPLTVDALSCVYPMSCKQSHPLMQVSRDCLAPWFTHLNTVRAAIDRLRN